VYPNEEIYVLDKFPFEEQRVINELVEFWQTRYEPCDLVTHIDEVSGAWGGVIDTGFFRQVYEDLCVDKHSYGVSSASEFKQLLEDKYHRAQKKDKTSFFKQRFEDLRKHSNYVAYSPLELKQHVDAEYRKARADAEAERQAQAKAKAERKARADAEAERQAQAKAKAERQAKEEAERQAKEAERIVKEAEHQRKARADFDALGKEMAKATTRAELVGLGRKRANLAPHTGFSYAYINHCWNCKKPISSDINSQCPNCKFYICSSCNFCFCV
jgi:hypothetical protein